MTCCPLIFSAGGRKEYSIQLGVAFGLEYKCYNENERNAMYIPYCINVIFSIVIFQLPFCGNASNATKIKNNPSRASKGLSWGFQLHEKTKIWIATYSFQASSLVGSDLKPKNQKKGTDNGFPPKQKLHVVIFNCAILNYKTKKNHILGFNYSIYKYIFFKYIFLTRSK